MIATLASVVAKPALPRAEPFGGLHQPPEVTTSRNEEAVRVGLGPTAYTIRLPEGFEDRSSETHAQS